MIRDLCVGLAQESKSAIVCLTGHPGFRPEGVEVEHLDLPADGFSMRGMLKLARFAGERGVQILHSHGRGAVAYAGGVRLMHRRMRLVHNVHRADGDPVSSKALVRDATLGAMDSIVAVSHAAAREFSVTNGVQQDRINVIYNGIDLTRFNQRRDGDSPPAKESSGYPTLGSIMNLSCDKDFTTLLNGFALVLSSYPNASLRIVGHGPAEVEVKQLSRELNIEQHVDFLGFRNDIPDLLSGFDVLIHSTRTEGLGIAVLEAMAAGVPVAATHVGGIPEIVKDGRSGVLFEPGDTEALSSAVVDLLENKEKRLDMIDSARQQVKARFSLQIMCGQYGELYSRIAEH